MSDVNARQSVPTECIDHLFARLGGNAEAVPAPPVPAPPVPAPAEAAGAASPPPGIRHAHNLKAATPPPERAGLPPPRPVIRPSNDLKAATAWLERERKRLDGYTQTQLERLHKEH